MKTWAFLSLKAWTEHVHTTQACIQRQGWVVLKETNEPVNKRVKTGRISQQIEYQSYMGWEKPKLHGQIEYLRYLY